MQWLLAVLVVCFCAFIWLVKFIDFKGALLSAVLILASAFWGKGGVADALAIFVVYILVFLMSLFKRQKRREIYRQVLQEDRNKSIKNVFGKVLLPVLLSFLGSSVGLTVVLAYGVADSASSQIGVFSRAWPHFITNFRSVPPGTSGAISLLGTVMGALLGIAIGVFYMWMLGQGIIAGLIWGLFGGLLGNLIDSVYGATIENRFKLSDWSVNFLSAATISFLALVVNYFV